MWNREEVKDFAAQGAVIGAAIAVGRVCTMIPIPWLALACAVVVGVEAGAILNTLKQAAEENKCVEIKFKWDGSLAGWKRYTCR